jgi:Tetratricopeptide repeat
MNLLARILSHGFGLAVVALLIIVLIYRGDLFQEGDLPEFLTFKNQPGSAEEAGSGAVDRRIDETAVSADATTVPSGSQENSMAPAPATGASDGIPPVDEMPAAATELSSEPGTHPVTHMESADVAEPDMGSDTAPVSDAPAVEGADEPSPIPVDSDDNSTAVPADDATVLIIEETVEVSSPAVEAPLVTVNEEATPAETTPAAVEQPLPDTVPAMAPPAAPAHEEALPTHPDTVTEAPYKVMAKAREAFWLRDFDTAEQQYRTLTQLEPDNPDGYGELGNMYFSQGKWDEAATAYYEAATRLLDEGLVVQAREMLEVIRGLNGPQVNDLEAQIDAASASSP